MDEQIRKSPADFIKKYWWVLTISFAICAILVLLLPVLKYEIREAIYDDFGERISKSDYIYSVNLISYFTNKLPHNFALYITLGTIAVGVGFSIGAIYKKELKTASGISFLIAICLFILLKEFFKLDEDGIVEMSPVITSSVGPGCTLDVSLHDVMVSWGIGLAITFCALAFATTTFVGVHRTTKEIAEEGVLISIAFVLNFIKVPIGATGGSINFQMLPLMVIALRRGPSHGFIAGGIVYGLLTCLTDGYGLACYPFDYLLAFGAVGVMGFFRKFIFSKDQKYYNFKGEFFILLGGILATFIRFIGGTVSSIVIYGYEFVPALAYNVLYIPLSGLVSVISVMILYGPLIIINQRFPTSYELKSKEITE